MELRSPQGRFDLLISLQLMRIERPGRSFGGEHTSRRFGLKRNQIPAGEGTGGLARAFHRSLQLLQVVRAGMQFEKGVQLALAFGELDVFRRRS